MIFWHIELRWCGGYARIVQRVEIVRKHRREFNKDVVTDGSSRDNKDVVKQIAVFPNSQSPIKLMCLGIKDIMIFPAKTMQILLLKLAKTNFFYIF